MLEIVDDRASLADCVDSVSNSSSRSLLKKRDQTRTFYDMSMLSMKPLYEWGHPRFESCLSIQHVQ